MKTTPLLMLLCLVISLGSVPTSALAQIPKAPAVGRARQRPPVSLIEAMERSAWEPEQRGPLLPLPPNRRFPCPTGRGRGLLLLRRGCGELKTR
jgi:hypothetical protein